MFWRMVNRTVEIDGEQHQVRSVKTEAGHEIQISCRALPIRERLDASDRGLQHSIAAHPDLVAYVRSDLVERQATLAMIERALVKNPKRQELQDQRNETLQKLAEAEAVLARADGRLS